MDGVVALGEETAALVRLDHDLQPARRGEEGHLDLVDRARLTGRRKDLDLLVAGQPLAGPPDVAELQVGGLEGVAELPERFQDRFLGGQRPHRQRVEVSLVPGARDLQLRADAEHGPEVLAVQFGDRRLPGQGDGERHGVFGLLRQPESAADREAVEDGRRLVLLVLALALDPGDEEEGDPVHRRVRSAAAQPDLAGEGAAGQGRSGLQDGVDRGSADPEGSEQLLEHHVRRPLLL